MESENSLFKDLLNKNGFELTTDQVSKFIFFISLVQEWNQKINITGHKKIEDLILKDLIDNLVLNRYVNKIHPQWNTFIDLGCGAGFSGLVLLIMNPEKRGEFLDTSQKKLNFVKYACRELHLTNTQFYHQRVEEYQKNQKTYDLVLSRATWGLTIFAKLAKKYVHNKGHILYLSGPNQVANLISSQFLPFFSIYIKEFYCLEPNNYERYIIDLERL
jgi:16S rRNA (guanine527-N7)-methyltransferase